MNKMTIPIVLGLLISLGLLGCTNTSTTQSSINSDQTNHLQITKGISKKQDVLEMFGQPQNKKNDKSGSECWIYDERINGTPDSYNPKEGEELVVTFDGDTVKEFAFTAGK